MKKFENFVSHLAVLERAGQEDLSNEFIISGIIDKFFIQFELGWKTLKEYLQYEGRGVASTGSPRAIIKEAYSVYGFIEEEIWLSMLQSRNNMAHIYDKEEAIQLVDVILDQYIPAFQKMKAGLLEWYPESEK